MYLYMNKNEFKQLIEHIISEAIEIINEDYHHLHKEFRLYEGSNHIVAVFEDNSRLMFEVHYHNNHGEDKEKHRRKAFTKWKSLASKIHGDIQLNEVGNPVEKSWKQSFKEAMEHPELQEYMRKPHHRKIYGSNAGIDPVNFTPRV